MIVVNNDLILDTDIETVLAVLRRDLAENGRLYFDQTKRVNDYIMTNCPSHKGGQERKPSCGVRTDTGLFHCFTCGYTESLPNVISELFGQKGTSWGIKYLKDNFQHESLSSRHIILPDMKRKVSVEKQRVITEEELQQYRYFHNYMWKRKLTPDIVQFFDVGFDPETNCITFPVKDIYGNCVFVARRSVDTKWFNYPSGANKPVYGLFKILQYGIKEVWVCESFINCLNCWQYGRPAVALIGTGSEQQYEILKKCGIRKFTLALDGDEAGYKGTQRFIEHLKNYAMIDVAQIPSGKDINDLTQQEFNNLKIIKINY